MKKYTAQTLTDEGYTIENAQITNVSLSTTDHCCLSLNLTLKAAGWGVVYGGYCRVATKGWGSTVKIIGNIINNLWFDYDSFFKDKESASVQDAIAELVTVSADLAD